MGLITRFYGPNDKGSKLTIKEMDDNLYYLQSFGVSGVTYQNNVLTLINPTGGTNTTIINDFYTTAATYNNGIIYFDRNDQLSAYTVNISSLTGNTNTSLTVGSTQISNGGNGRILFQSGTSLQQDNSLFWDNTNKRLGVGTTTPTEKLDVGGKTKTTNLQVTSGANNGYVLTSDISGNATWQSVPHFTGGTVNGSTIFTNGLSANTISATTYQNLPIDPDTYLTGGTYSNGVATFTNNTGGTFNVSGFYTGGTPSVNYTIYKVLLTYSLGSFSVTQLENTIGDGSNLSPNDIEWSNPYNATLHATKLFGFTNPKISIEPTSFGGGTALYMVTGIVQTNSVIEFIITKYDGDTSSTPYFGDLPIEIRIYN